MRRGWNNLRDDWATNGRIFIPPLAGAWYSTWSYAVFPVNEAVHPEIAAAISSYSFDENYEFVLVATCRHILKPEEETLFNQAKRYFYVVDGFATEEYAWAFAEAIAQTVKGSRTWTGDWHEVDGKRTGYDILNLANEAIIEINNEAPLR